MVYRMTVRSNPRILFVYVVLPVILAAGIAAPFLLGLLYGLIALAAAAFLAWQLHRLTRRQLATRIETLTDELVFRLHGDEKITMPWQSIRIAGFALHADEAGVTTKKDRRLFVYNEAEDRMFTLTNEFENLDGLASELREKTDFRELILGPGETLKEKLRGIVGGPLDRDVEARRVQGGTEGAPDKDGEVRRVPGGTEGAP
jgi:hypothetical protein